MNLEEAKADCEEELQIVESILEARRNKGGVSGDLTFVRTYIGLLEKRSLIDPEPEKEEKAEAIELGQTLERAIVKLLNETTLENFLEHDRLLISRILELVGERR